MMRTTIDIDEDVLLAIKELARRDGVTAGALISTLLRKALTSTDRAAAGAAKAGTAHYGFRPLTTANSGAGQLVSNDQVNQLRNEQGI
jgi:hypothetical protein